MGRLCMPMPPTIFFRIQLFSKIIRPSSRPATVVLFASTWCL
jgi:hypothetical protein